MRKLQLIFKNIYALSIKLSKLNISGQESTKKYNSYRLKNFMNSINANIFTDIPAELPEELFECIVKQENVLIERIVSKGHMTPIGQWYDQDWDEWIMLLQGQATILYEQNMQSITLTPGDYLLIPAHIRHRVEWTTPDRHTIWLAVHLH